MLDIEDYEKDRVEKKIVDEIYKNFEDLQLISCYGSRFIKESKFQN